MFKSALNDRFQFARMFDKIYAFFLLSGVPIRKRRSHLAPTLNGSIETFEATPARWNAWHPKTCPVGSRWRCLCPQPAGPVTPAVRRRRPLSLDPHKSDDNRWPHLFCMEPPKIRKCMTMSIFVRNG